MSFYLYYIEICSKMHPIEQSCIYYDIHSQVDVSLFLLCVVVPYAGKRVSFLALCSSDICY